MNNEPSTNNVCAIPPSDSRLDDERREMGNRREVSVRRKQGIFWLCTIPHYGFVPYLPPCCRWIKGQLERGHEQGYVHWQFVVAFSKKFTLRQARECFGDYAMQLSRSSAANEYCAKEDTKIPGTEFELGTKPFERNKARDWEEIWVKAKEGNLEAIPADVRVVSYRTLRTIGSDYMVALPMVRIVNVYWGVPGSGKSRLAWEQAGLEAYGKDPRSKFWDGYISQQNVVIDEFRGGIDIAHLLRWTDRYAVRVEVKGSSRPLNCKNIWITSNLPPTAWYPDIDVVTMEALLRRLIVREFT